MLLRRFPLELSSTGFGFDPASGQHKVVRLFRNIFGQQKCEVCSPTASGEWRRSVRCARLRHPASGGGGNAPPRFACYVDGRPPVALDGSLYWLLQSSAGDPRHDAPILSLSVGAERFGWVRTPPRLASRIRHFTSLDGSLCVVVHDRLIDDVLLLVTWSPSSPSAGYQQIISPTVPLCSVKKKILLVTSRHKVYAYGTEHGAAEEVFDMNSFVDVPLHRSESRLLVNISLQKQVRRPLIVVACLTW
ncbi:hypothetical protein ZWY2020_012030 [Hordeum vulgare]|nr:hypothetical protein ZWY2020_012030 [Hordeum vulgare]